MPAPQLFFCLAGYEKHRIQDRGVGGRCPNPAVTPKPKHLTDTLHLLQFSMLCHICALPSHTKVLGKPSPLQMEQACLHPVCGDSFLSNSSICKQKSSTVVQPLPVKVLSHLSQETCGKVFSDQQFLSSIYHRAQSTYTVKAPGREGAQQQRWVLFICLFLFV